MQQQQFEERHRTPLTRREAEALAARLRRRYGPKLGYRSLAVVMGEYHDHWYSADVWRHACRARGAEPAPRGALVKVIPDA